MSIGSRRGLGIFTTPFRKLLLTNLHHLVNTY
nr:MAG TPA: DNA-directed RNA polymerase II subunit [Caudoviricetes sp.]